VTRPVISAVFTWACAGRTNIKARKLMLKILRQNFILPSSRWKDRVETRNVSVDHPGRRKLEQRNHHTEAENDARITSAEIKNLSLPICGFFQFNEGILLP